MLDFASSAYLGLGHGAGDLGVWPELTTSRPAALGGAVLADRAARSVAVLQGCEDGLAGASTLHLATDLFDVGLPNEADIHWDAHLYPVMRRALRLGQRTHRLAGPLRAHDPGALAQSLASRSARGRRGTPVFATDGYCIECGRAAPLADYLAKLEPHGGLLVVDDTQALGLFGPGAAPEDPFGYGGGGTLPAQSIRERDCVVVIVSLAKAFGASMAVLSGPAALVDRIRTDGLSRIHCSPPAVPVALAALRALRINRRSGRHLRRQLARALRLFRSLCRSHDLPLAGGFHPVQTIALAAEADVARLAGAAMAAGLIVVPCKQIDGEPALRLVVKSAHGPDQLAKAVEILSYALGQTVRSMPERSAEPPDAGAHVTIH